MKKKLTWQQRQDIAFRAFRPCNYKFAINVSRLRMSLFSDNRVPKDLRKWFNSIAVYNTKHQFMGLLNIEVRASKSVGEKQTRGGRGHRMWVQCPACAREDGMEPVMIPVGRLHQHYGYKHQEAVTA